VIIQSTGNNVLCNRKFLICVLFFILGLAFLVLPESSEAASRREEYFKRPQIGAWFGPITPVGPTADLVDTDLGFGLFLRFNLPFDLWKIGLDSSYQNYESEGVNELTLAPVIGNVLFQLPINLPIRFQLKAGFGVTYLYMKPDEYGQWDPTFFAGFEVSFPAGRLVNIGLRVDYLMVIENHIEGSRHNGHFINSGIMLYFNL
jgi:hypothetical protein